MHRAAEQITPITMAQPTLVSPWRETWGIEELDTYIYFHRDVQYQPNYIWNTIVVYMCYSSYKVTTLLQPVIG